MLRKIRFNTRWVLLLAAGGVLLQAPTCVDIVQTGLLAFLAGTTYFLASNV